VRNDENMKRMFFYGTPCISAIDECSCVCMCQCSSAFSYKEPSCR